MPNIGPLTDDYSNGEFTPTASLMYSLNPSWNLYATYSSGYKSGGFNVDVLSTADNISFDAERVDNFELGAKTVLFDGRAWANLAVFYMDYKDLQVTQYDPDTFSNYIGNAASASVSGIEFDLVAQPTAHLNISADWDCSMPASTGSSISTSVDLKGNDLPFAELQRIAGSGIQLVDQFRCSVHSSGWRGAIAIERTLMFRTIRATSWSRTPC